MTDGEFIELYNAQAAALLRYCALRLDSHHEAEDVTAEVFARALVKLDRVAANDRVRWLFVVARNLCADAQRQARRRSQVRVAASDGADGSPWIDERVSRAVRSLPRSQQEVVFLRVLEDRSFAEAARILGRPESYVRVLYHRALKRLRTIAKEVGT